MADADNRPSPLLVILAGLLTTAAALGGVWWLDRHTDDFHVMGWYANYVFPVGAFLVGLAAGIGYGVASWWSGLKIRRGLLAAVVLFQLAGYGTAEWLEYRSDLAAVNAREDAEGVPADERGEPLSFASYFDLRTTSFRWEEHGKVGEPIGRWGYLFVGLAILGFVGGGLVIPGVMMFKPYCEDCTRYMRTRPLGAWAGSAPLRRIRKKDAEGQAAYAAENARAAEEAQAKLERIAALAAKRDGYALRQELPPQSFSEKRAVHKLPLRMSVNLVHCPGCRKSHLQPLVITGQGNGVRSRKLAPLAASPEIVRAFVDQT